MNLYSIDSKKFKSIFYQIQISNIIALIVTFILLKQGVYLLAGFDPGKKLTIPILGLMVVLAFVFATNQRKQLSRIVSIEDFDTRVAEYEKFYKFRMLWYLVSCFVSCGLVLLTGRYVFLIYGVFDILVALPFYPSLLMFKKELQNEEIILH